MKLIYSIGLLALALSTNVFAGACAGGKSFNGTNVGQYIWDDSSQVWRIEKVYYSAAADREVPQSGDINLTTALGNSGGGGGGGPVLQGMTPADGDLQTDAAIDSTEIKGQVGSGGGVTLNGTSASNPCTLPTMIVTGVAPAPSGASTSFGQVRMTVIEDFLQWVFGRQAINIPHRKDNQNRANCTSDTMTRLGSANWDVQQYQAEIMQRQHRVLGSGTRVIVHYDDNGSEGWAIDNPYFTQQLLPTPGPGTLSCP